MILPTEENSGIKKILKHHVRLMLKIFDLFYKKTFKH